MEHFRYHAYAVGFSGSIKEPLHEEIPIQASVALSPNGGFGASRVERFRLHEIVSVASIVSRVSGSFCENDQTYDAVATVISEHLDILGVVTADRIVARVAVSHPKQGGAASFTLLGSYFENLRIAGRLVEVDLATDTFDKFDTWPKLHDAYNKDTDGFRKEFDALTLAGKADEIPDRLKPHFPWSGTQGGDKLPTRTGEVHCGLVRGISGSGKGLPYYGHAIHVRGFGVIRLAELTRSESLITLTMLQIGPACTPGLKTTSNAVVINGGGY